MQRNEWNFHYTGKQLLEAAKSKVSHHKNRYNWWLARKDALLVTIRSEGLEVSEAQALQHSGHKARDWNKGGKGVISSSKLTRISRLYSCLSDV